MGGTMVRHQQRTSGKTVERHKPRAVSIALSLLALCFIVPLPATAQISDGVVRIGVLGDYGSGRDLGGPGSVTAAKLAAEDFGGKVLSKPIQILGADHQNKPDIASAIARKWFDIEHVDAITDLAVSSVGLAVERLAAQMSRTVLISGAATSEITGQHCAAVATQWSDDTYVLSAGLGRALTERVGKKWFFMTVDQAFGTAMYADGKAAVEKAGGQVVGRVSFPFNPPDFASYFIPAQNSGANIVAIASTGNDLIVAVKQAHEFGMPAAGFTLVGMLTFISDVHTLGLDIAQGLYVASEYYWDADDGSRAFAKRFFEIEKKQPTKLQASTYAAVRHYLRAIESAGTDEAIAVNKKMREMPVEFFGRSGRIRTDGRVIYDLALYQVKTPAESRYPWDYYKKIADMPGETTFRSETAGGCPLVAGANTRASEGQR
jgi:branched-chain amino acid transport system substrate-binding protein